MLSIGQFSRACHVSVKTLRHYEKVGLLPPTRVDSWTGCRYYDEALIDTMLLIQRLKRYGFSLVAIGRILTDPAFGPEALRRQRQTLSDQTLILHALDRHLAAVERTNDIMAYQPEYIITLREVPEHPMLSHRQRMSAEDYGSAIGKLFEDAARMLPGGLMAVTAHQGSYGHLADAYGAMTRWIARQSLEISGAPCEVCLQGPGQSHPEAWRTEICFPARLREAPSSPRLPQSATPWRIIRLSGAFRRPRVEIRPGICYNGLKP